MALNWNLQARTFINSKPQVDRAPQWSDGVFYAPGSIVARYFPNDSDSDLSFSNWYVNRVAVQPGQDVPENNSNWVLFISTDPLQPNFFKDSEVYSYIDNAQQDYTKKLSEVDSDVTVLNEKIVVLEEIDSELRKVEHRAQNLEEKNIIDSLFDSDRKHDNAIVWDSDLSKFKFNPLVKTVNSKLPDAEGNVEITLAKTKTGPRDDRPDSDIDGAMWIVSDDSDTSANSTLYIYNEDTHAWMRIIGYADVENDKLYINAAGDSMVGPLKVLTPDSDSDVVTKKYVDDWNDVTKQDKILVFDSEFQMAVAAPLHPEGTIARVRYDDTLWFIKNGAFTKFNIPILMASDPAFSEAKVIDIPNTIVRIEVYRFSEQEEGKLYVFRNGVASGLLLANNCAGSVESIGVIKNFRLLDARKQYFDIQLSTLNYSSDAVYTIKYVSHNGVTTDISIRGFATNRILFANTGRSLNYGEY